MSSSDHTPVDVDQDTVSRIVLNSDRDKDNAALNKRSTISIAEKPNTYSASGLKNTLHGDIYQLKLLMLFLKRGLDKGYSFRLATEMDDAEKFDDLVFEYENERKDGTICRFLQAKHTQDETKKISFRDLLADEDKDFSLQKYFMSFRKIKGNPKFKGCEIKDFVICTNTDLIKKLRESFEPVESEDDILKYDVEESERLKLIVSKFPKEEELVSRLKETSDLKRLAKRLAECVSKNKPLNLRDDLFRSYHFVLGERVVDVKNAKFHDIFLGGNSQELKNFRRAFKEAYLEMPKVQMNDGEFWQKMGEKKLTLSRKFGKVFELDTNPQLTDPKEFAKAIAIAMSKAEDGTVKIRREGRGKGTIKKNIDKLAGHVLIKKDCKEKDIYYFSSAFFYDNNKLQGNLEIFKNELKTELESKDIQFDGDKYRLRIVNFKTCEEEQLHVEPSLPDDHIAEEEIKDFFEKLVFAVKQPNENKLGGIIKDELGKEFNYLDTENIYNRFLVKMLDWMKEKQGRFILREEGKDFFEKITEEVLGSIWFNVKDPVRLFTGREKELGDLHEAVQRNKGSNKFAVISQMTTISGLGGIGKSELAIKYASDHCQDYDGNVIWIDAETCGTMEESFRNLATDNRLGIHTEDLAGKEKKIDSLMKEIYRFFSKRKSLFIFDNAEKSDDLEKFLPLRHLSPKDNKPYLLITSREKEWDSGIKAVELEGLKLEDAIQLVRNGLGVAEEDKTHNQEIGYLVGKLQCFPLALQQAVAHITEENKKLKRRGEGEYTIRRYLEEYEEKKKELLNSKAFKNIDNDYAKTTFTTWEVTIDKIKGDKESGERALEILDVIAYFAPDNIPANIFVSKLEKDDEKTWKDVELLNQYSMIKLEEGKLRIHRLVQEVTRLKLKEQGNEEKTLEKALQLVNKNLKKENLDHAMSAWVHLDKKYEKLVKEYCGMPKKIAEELCKDGRYEENHIFEEKTLPLLQKVLGENHLQVAIMHRYLGNAYGEVGKHEEQKKYLEKALEIFDNLLKGNSEELFEQVLSTSTFKEDFVLVQDQGDDTKKGVWIRVIEVEIARTKRNLGNAYGDLANSKDDKEEKKALIEKEIGLFEEALGIFNKYAGDGNRLEVDVAKTKRNLGSAYGELASSKDDKEGKNELIRKKIRYLKEALRIFKKYAQDGNRLEVDIAKTKRNLGNAYGDLANYKDDKEEKKGLIEKKIGLLEDALEIFNKYAQDENRLEVDIAKTKRNLGNAYGDLANYKDDKEEKKGLIEEKIGLLEEALGIFNKYTQVGNRLEVANAKTKRNLCKAYGNLANFESNEEEKENLFKK